MKLSGVATPEGTDRYQKRFAGRIPPEHFRQTHGLWVSSIGIGTYLGNHDEATDEQYRQAVVRAVESGCNVIDTAINYRCQRSERAIGAALKELAARGFDRSEIVIATKGGFLPFDAAPPKDPTQLFRADFRRHRPRHGGGDCRRISLHDAALLEPSARSAACAISRSKASTSITCTTRKANWEK